MDLTKLKMELEKLPEREQYRVLMGIIHSIYIV